MTDESLIEGPAVALKARRKQKRRRGARSGDVAQRLNRIAEDCAALPDVDPRSPDEIIGYDEHGVPR